MRTKTIGIYKFEELSPKAKQSAIDAYRAKGYQPAWTDENFDTLRAFEKVFPIKITNSSYGDRGEGVTFHFTDYSTSCEVIEELSGQRLATYIWNNYRGHLYKGKYYSNKPVGSNNHRSRHSKIQLETSCVLTGYCIDDDILDPIYAFLKKPLATTTFRHLLEDCFDAWVKACNADIEWQDSDEYISDYLIANDYEFTEDGKQY